MTGKFAMLVYLAALCAGDSLASNMLGRVPEFTDDATNVALKLDIVSTKDRLEYGEIDCDGYEAVVRHLSHMPQLKSLSVVFIGAPHDEFRFPLERLSGLTNLVSLAISNYGTNSITVASLSSCAAMPLKDLELMYVGLEDSCSIREFKSLESLSCTSQQILLGAPSNLRFLHVENAECEKCLDLERFHYLETLQLVDIECSSIIGMASLTGLKRLQLCGVAVGDLSVIRAFSKLEFLEIANPKECGGNFNTAILGAMPLHDMELENVSVMEIRGLEGCPLVNLRINGSAIKSLNNICRLPQLKRLDVANTGVNTIDRQKVKERYPKLESLYYSDDEMNLQFVEW